MNLSPENKYARLLSMCTADLRDEALNLANTEEPTLEQLQAILSTIQQVKNARISAQVWEDAR